jgi:hypothetical protein
MRGSILHAIRESLVSSPETRRISSVVGSDLRTSHASTRGRLNAPSERRSSKRSSSCSVIPHALREVDGARAMRRPASAPGRVEKMSSERWPTRYVHKKRHRVPVTLCLCGLPSLRRTWPTFESVTLSRRHEVREDVLRHGLARTLPRHIVEAVVNAAVDARVGLFLRHV